MNDETQTPINSEPEEPNYPLDANGNIAYPDTSPEEIARKEYKESQERQEKLKKKRMKIGAAVVAIALVTGYGGFSIVKDVVKAVPEIIKSAQESNKLEHKFEGEIKYYEVQPGEGWEAVAKQLKNHNNYEIGGIIEAIKSIPENTAHLEGILQRGAFIAYRELPGDNPIEETYPIGVKPMTKDEVNN